MYGPNTQGNELTKFLIANCHNAKKQYAPGYKDLNEWLQAQLASKKSTSVVETQTLTGHSVQEFYSSSAYGCMCSVISKTQSKEVIFNQYLFQANRDKGDLLWELIIDTDKKLNFEIETAFHMKLLEKNPAPQPIQESSIAQSYQQYFTDSLFVQSQSIATNQAVALIQAKKQEPILPKPEDQSSSYEEDKINKQPTMLHVLRLFAAIEKKFSKEWKSDSMPQFMQALRFELSRQETTVNVKIFILKLLVNKPAFFKPYAKEWFEPVMSYLLESKEQGKGFHYFSRDLCTTLLGWEYIPYAERRAIELCSGLINNIIKVLPDKTAYIFHMNVRVLGALIEKLAGLTYINKTVITSMITMDEKKESADLWRLNAMQVLAFSSGNNIPICDSLDQYLTIPLPKSFRISETDQIYKKLLDNLNFHKKTVSLAAADALGRIHKRMRSKQLDETLAMYLISNVAGKNVGNLAQYCERIVQNYPEILGERKLYLKLVGLIQGLSGSFRKHVLIALHSYLAICRSNNNGADIDEMCQNLQANAKSIVLDNLEEHKIALLTLILALIQVPLDSVTNLCSVIIPLMQCDSYLHHKQETIRLLVIQIMSRVYDQIPKLKKYARSAISVGFADRSPKIQEFLYNIWDNEDRLKNDPGSRLIAIMRDLYVGDDDNSHWVSTALALLLGLTKRSSDYLRKIYEQPLSKCSFNKLNIFQNNFLFNRSQPLTLLSSSFSDAAGSAKVEVEKPEEVKEDLHSGMIRATQVQIFTQTQEQSLILGNSRDGSFFGDSFYQIDAKKRDVNAPQKAVELAPVEKQQDGFKIPDITALYRKSKKNLSKFFAAGDFTYGPQMVGDRIRYTPLGSQANPKLGTQREQQENKWKSRMNNSGLGRNQASICREYRVGELPDIEILYKDIIEPLRLLSLKDASIASEIFVNLFAGIYFTEPSQDIQTQLCHYLGELLLQKNHNASYQTVYALHQVFIKFIKEGVDISLAEAQFASAEQNALSFQTSILAIEHAIIGLHQRVFVPSKKKKDEVGYNKKPGEIACPGVSEHNRHLWLQLGKLYKQINYADYAAGIYSIISEDVGSYIIQDVGENLPVLLNGILKSKLLAKHSHCIELSQNLLTSPDLAQAVHQDLIRSIRKERYESLASLSQWDDLANELGEADGQELWSLEGQEELTGLLRSRIRCEKTWEKETKDMERWLQDTNKKDLLLKHYSYELALHSMIQQDLDRSIYYVDRELTKIQQKWSNISSMSFVTMHYLVQHLQKIHEFYECLNILKKENIEPKEKLVDQAINLCSKWKDRNANVHFDSIHTWDDILHSRCLFLDILNSKFGDLKTRLNTVEDVKDLVAHFYTQVAHAAYKKNLFESTDKYLRLALKHRTDPNTSSLSLTYPIIKLKAKQHQIEGILMEPFERISKYQKIIEIANGENSKVQGKSIQLLLLSSKLSQIVAKEYVNGGWLEDYAKCIDTCFELLNRAVEQINGKGFEGSRKQQAKVHFTYANFCDGILRQLDSEQKECIFAQLEKFKVDPTSLAINVIEHGFASINAGHDKATYLIPRLIEILSQQYHNKKVGETFSKDSASTPAWIFLPWINQLITIMDEPASEAISAKFVEMVDKYPQPIMYAFKVAQSNKEIDLLKMEHSGHSLLYDNIVSIFENSSTLNSWIEALDGLVFPEHRMKYWLELMKEVFPNDTMKDAERMKRYVIMCYYDIFSLEK